jgi:hypothetical protein
LTISGNGDKTVDTDLFQLAALGTASRAGVEIIVNTNNGANGIKATGTNSSNAHGAIELTNTSQLSSLTLTARIITAEKPNATTIFVRRWPEQIASQTARMALFPILSLVAINKTQSQIQTPL